MKTANVMSWLFPAVVCAFLFEHAALAQRAAQSPLVVTVTRDKTDGGRTTHYDTGYDSSKSYNAKVSLKIAVRNMITNSVETKIEALFVADAMSAGSADGIYCKRETSATLNPGESRDFSTESDPLESHVYKSYEYSSKSGSRFKGYIVRVFADGQLVEVNASQPSLKKTGWDEKTVKKMLGEKDDAPDGGDKKPPPQKKGPTSF